ncbi:MAG: SUMF1/EgtB/PvdO family nonheme iron enzyme [Spirochaetota bacterium]
MKKIYAASLAAIVAVIVSTAVFAALASVLVFDPMIITPNASDENKQLSEYFLARLGEQRTVERSVNTKYDEVFKRMEAAMASGTSDIRTMLLKGANAVVVMNVFADRYDHIAVCREAELTTGRIHSLGYAMAAGHDAAAIRAAIANAVIMKRPEGSDRSGALTSGLLLYNGEMMTGVGAALSDVILSESFTSFPVVELARRDRYLYEQELVMSGAVETERLALQSDMFEEPTYVVRGGVQSYADGTSVYLELRTNTGTNELVLFTEELLKDDNRTLYDFVETYRALIDGYKKSGLLKVRVVIPEGVMGTAFIRIGGKKAYNAGNGDERTLRLKSGVWRIIAECEGCVPSVGDVVVTKGGSAEYVVSFKVSPPQAADTDKLKLKSLEAALAARWKELKPVRGEYDAKRADCRAEWKKKRDEISKDPKGIAESDANYAVRLKKEADEAASAEKGALEVIAAAEEKEGKWGAACRDAVTKAAELAEASVNWELGKLDGESKTIPLKGEVKLLGLTFKTAVVLPVMPDAKTAWAKVTGRYAAKEYQMRIPFEVAQMGDRIELRPMEMKIGATGDDDELWIGALARTGSRWAVAKNEGGAIKNIAGIRMILVAGGSYLMGKDGALEVEMPAHQVKISSFYIGKYEVTQMLYKAVMGTNPSSYQGDTIPVDLVSWFDAVDFCNKLSVRVGLKPAYRGSGNNVVCDWTANGFRLPTEAEWEYAARGGQKSMGYLYAGGNDLDAVAWYDKNNTNNMNTFPVGMKAPNELGIYDMSGNVWEWCWDWHHTKYYSESPGNDPHGPLAGDKGRTQGRIVRGGCSYSANDAQRAARRYGAMMELRSSGTGFRLVLPFP